LNEVAGAETFDGNLTFALQVQFKKKRALRNVPLHLDSPAAANHNVSCHL